MPAFRNDSSRRRFASVSKLYSVTSKIFGSGWKRDLRAGLVGGADLVQVFLRDAALVALAVDLAAQLDLEVELVGERVHARDADAVQTARDLVGLVVELAARVQRRQHDLGRGPAELRVRVDRDAAAVVVDGDRVVAVDRDSDRVAEAGDGLVDRVVDDLVDQVVQATRARSTRCTSQAVSGPDRDPREPRWISHRTRS